MASKPGILTEWPWTPLGSFKYIVLAPWAIHSTYTFITKGEKERDLTYFLIFPYLLVRMLHDQIWISLSRYRNAKGSNKIVDKSIEFEQVDRESNWDDQILFNGLLFYIGYTVLDNAKNMPIWRTDGVIITSLLHSGPVEFLYYWLHRALHHHFLYSRYHSHHHSSIITEPITSVIHPFAEHIAYFILFAIPLLTTIWTKTASIASFSGYIFYIDFMNNMGHCNFELIPKWLFTVFPPLKYIMYTPSFHSLHHTQFRTNYCLFMPFYDYLYGTTDKSTDNVYETSLKRREESPDVVHLTHLTTPESVYHLRSGFAAVASKPFTSTWYLWMLWPFTLWSVFITWIYGLTFISESNTFKNLKLQTWVVPRYNIQYLLPWRKESINGMIERAILDADIKGVKVLTLGLQNQGEEINGYGELFIRKQPNLKVKLVDGSSLAIALILNNIPKETAQVLLRGNLTKVACVVANSLCERGIKVATLNKEEHEKLKLIVDPQFICNLVISKAYTDKIWLVGERWNEEEQMKATNGTTFIPFSQFPPKKMRKDCVYYSTPAMIIPDSFKNMHSCENWLPRRVMSAWRIAGIVHGLEGWNTHETGKTVFSIEKIWEASLQHGFQPYMTHV